MDPPPYRKKKKIIINRFLKSVILNKNNNIVSKGRKNTQVVSSIKKDVNIAYSICHCRCLFLTEMTMNNIAYVCIHIYKHVQA